MKRRTRQMGKLGGFTIIELMIVLTIAGVLVMVGAPSFTETIRENRRAALMRSFAAGLVTARTEAVKRPTSRVVMCVSTNGTSCSSSGTWASGWIVFRDDNANQAVNGSEPVLLQREAFPDGYTLHPVTSLYSSWFSFRSTGDVQGSGGIGNDVFQLCGPDGDEAKAKYLRVSAFGQITSVATPPSMTCP